MTQAPGGCWCPRTEGCIRWIRAGTIGQLYQDSPVSSGFPDNRKGPRLFLEPRAPLTDRNSQLTLPGCQEVFVSFCALLSPKLVSRASRIPTHERADRETRDTRHREDRNTSSCTQDHAVIASHPDADHWRSRIVRFFARTNVTVGIPAQKRASSSRIRPPPANSHENVALHLNIQPGETLTLTGTALRHVTSRYQTQTPAKRETNVSHPLTSPELTNANKRVHSKNK